MSRLPSARQLHTGGGLPHRLCWASTICCWVHESLAFSLSLIDTPQVVLQRGLGGILQVIL